MGIVKKIKDLFGGKPDKTKPKKPLDKKPDPNLEALRKKAKEQGGKTKLKPGTAKPTKVKKRGR